MKLKIENNTLKVLIDEVELDYGGAFKKSPQMPDTSSLSSSVTFKKIEVNNLRIEIPYEIFREIVRVWEVRFNLFLPYQKKKIIEDALNLSSIVENIKGENFDEIKSVETELKETYKNNLNIVITIDKSGVELYNTDYIWYLRPTSAFTFESYLIPKKIFEQIEDDELKKDFFLAIEFPFSLIQDNLSDTRTSVNEIVELGESEIPFAYKEMPEKLEKVYIKLPKFFAANNSMLPELFDMYYSLNKFAIKKFEEQMHAQNPQHTFVKAYTSRVYGSQTLFKMVGLRGMKIDDDTLSWWVVQRTYYVYADIFFPTFMHLENDNLITYYTTLDDKKRNCYGPFSKGALGIPLQTDEPIDENFNAFFIYDFIQKDNLPPITKTILPYPEFDENNQ